MEDLEFLVELVNHADVQPFLGGRAARDGEAIVAEIARSENDPTAYGRFVIEVDGTRAGVLGFEVSNRRSRIAHLERLAVHPDFRGRRIADQAALLFRDPRHGILLHVRPFELIGHIGDAVKIDHGRDRRRRTQPG